MYYLDIFTKNALHIREKMGKLCKIFLGFDPFTLLVALVNLLFTILLPTPSHFPDEKFN